MSNVRTHKLHHAVRKRRGAILPADRSRPGCQPKAQTSTERLRKSTPTGTGAPFWASAPRGAYVGRAALSPRIGHFSGHGLARCQPEGGENSKRKSLARRLGFEPITFWLTSRSEMVTLLVLACQSNLPFRTRRVMTASFLRHSDCNPRRMAR
jgi:hypothetical protein